MPMSAFFPLRSTVPAGLRLLLISGFRPFGAQLLLGFLWSLLFVIALRFGQGRPWRFSDFKRKGTVT